MKNKIVAFFLVLSIVAVSCKNNYESESLTIENRFHKMPWSPQATIHQLLFHPKNGGKKIDSLNMSKSPK
ncbi:MAG: hypothetical protein QM528_05605 [Phycisphaerales bacterium]|nr:hypothetical protein [Phycisphaerales bacterium]